MKFIPANANVNRKLLGGQKTFVRGRGGQRLSPREDVECEAAMLPPYTDTLNKNKEYFPDTFAGQHVSDTLRENEELKVKVTIFIVFNILHAITLLVNGDSYVRIILTDDYKG